ncbi:hypothetical protein [Companilactobacillus versmoldensis]|uniref:Uncharacterized protein n=1 Tax=Companilactobacillus versmoldensis DSM 14857 = KCTC 3814 TaxID=1423815 RepID=A0A0R1SMN2_9LACO|nr:hypothetical protein [Companilactobacillus versmoldensis]KRL67304.1 hypothetical protein FC27_GL001892 [Companilactobacillus versmoldensis DSM 14857 = KCTC 3814]
MRAKWSKRELYEDKYFNPGNGFLKFKELMITIAGWIFVLSLMTFVLISIGSNNIPSLIPHSKGLYAVNHLAIILISLSIISFLICIFLTIMNNYRNNSFFDTNSVLEVDRQKKREKIYEKFVTKRFGNQEYRQNIKICNIKPEQNLPVDCYLNLYNQNDLNDVD